VSVPVSQPAPRVSVTVVPAPLARSQKAAIHPSRGEAAGWPTWEPRAAQPPAGVGIWAASGVVVFGTQAIATTTKMSLAWCAGMVTVGAPVVTPVAVLPWACSVGAVIYHPASITGA
jgi:hypothetical protein